MISGHSTEISERGVGLQAEELALQCDGETITTLEQSKE
jgi:hypothetical protein